ncbi:hypothetical protein J3A83DRAFT_4090749, partial [Scleroderma citrinum]
VGKGLHSDDHIAKLKPALEELMKKYFTKSSVSSGYLHSCGCDLPAELDPNNPGILIVCLR